MREIFRKLATAISNGVGSPFTFAAALILVSVWVLTGPAFHYSQTWQLVINTATTIVTFLIVFILQYTQNRDSRALHIKLDELLKGVKGARTSMVDIEELSDRDLDDLEKEFRDLHGKYTGELQKRKRS